METLMRVPGGAGITFVFAVAICTFFFDARKRRTRSAPPIATCRPSVPADVPTPA